MNLGLRIYGIIHMILTLALLYLNLSKGLSMHSYKKWYSELETNQVLNILYIFVFVYIKTNFCLEYYLEIVKVYARIFCKNRISAHNFETCRYGLNRLQRDEIFYQLLTWMKSIEYEYQRCFKRYYYIIVQIGYTFYFWTDPHC